MPRGQTPAPQRHRLTKVTKTEKKPQEGKNRITRGVGYAPTPRRRPGK